MMLNQPIILTFYSIVVEMSLDSFWCNDAIGWVFRSAIFTKLWAFVEVDRPRLVQSNVKIYVLKANARLGHI